MPIRDVVIFPYMMTPFVVGRESSVRALEEALAADKKIFLATQHDASIDEPKPNEIYQVGTIVNIVQSLKLPDGNIKVLVEGIERGKDSADHRDRRLHAGFGARGPLRDRDQPADRSRHAAGHRPVRAVRKALPVAELRDHDRGRAHGRSGQADRHHRRQPAALHRRKTGTAGNLRSRRAPDPHRRRARHRNRKAEHGPHHPVARKAADGARAERVLPQRKDQGHPEGTGPRREERIRRTEEEDRSRRHAQGSHATRRCRN